MQPMHKNDFEIQHPVWNVRGRALVLDRVFVMGIVNVTPDSFADGGRLKMRLHSLEESP
jgi:hypothetical protein